MIYCKVCTRPQRAEIEHALPTTKTPLRALGQQYGMSHSSLHRHNHSHLAPARRRAPRPLSAHDQQQAELLAKWGRINRVLRASRR